MLTQTHINRIVFALNDAFKDEVAQDTINALSGTLQHIADLENKVNELEAKVAETTPNKMSENL